jgi:hypothetical protein
MPGRWFTERALKPRTSVIRLMMTAWIEGLGVSECTESRSRSKNEVGARRFSGQRS